jgi:hypothetical protein
VAAASRIWRDAADNVTVSGNTTTGPGGGVRNTSGTLSVRNTIVAGNTADTNPDVAGTLNSLGNNLIGISAGNNGVTNNVNGDKVGTGPRRLTRSSALCKATAGTDRYARASSGQPGD